MLETNGKSGDNSGSESVESSNNKVKRSRKSNRSKGRENKVKMEKVSDDKDSDEPDIIEEDFSDDRNGDNDQDEDSDEMEEDSSPVVGLAANRSRRSTAGTNSKRDSTEVKVCVSNSKEESTPAVTIDEASSEVFF